MWKQGQSKGFLVDRRRVKAAFTNRRKRLGRGWQGDDGDEGDERGRNTETAPDARVESSIRVVNILLTKIHYISSRSSAPFAAFFEIGRPRKPPEKIGKKKPIKIKELSSI